MYRYIPPCLDSDVPAEFGIRPYSSPGGVLFIRPCPRDESCILAQGMRLALAFLPLPFAKCTYQDLNS